MQISKVVSSISLEFQTRAPWFPLSISDYCDYCSWLIFIKIAHLLMIILSLKLIFSQTFKKKKSKKKIFFMHQSIEITSKEQGKNFNSNSHLIENKSSVETS